jgi:hypothetical protein
MPNPLAEATTKVLEILSPLDTSERKRVVSAALTLLGEEYKPGSSSTSQLNAGHDPEMAGMSSGAQIWARKNQVSVEQLEQFVHIDNGTAHAIALPGATTKTSEQVVTTYLLCGILSLMERGEPSFTDEKARQLCERFGCYDATNHAKYVKAIGNKVTGSKSTGWKLTVPGLNAAAALIKQTVT